MERDEFYNNLSLYHSDKTRGGNHIKGHKLTGAPKFTNENHPDWGTNPNQDRTNNKYLSKRSSNSKDYKSPTTIGFNTNLEPATRQKIEAANSMIRKANNDLSLLSRNDLMYIRSVINLLTPN